MGSYGIGISRLMGTVVEVLSDDNGIVWPEEIAPFTVHIVELQSDDKEVENVANTLYSDLIHSDIDVLYDDRRDLFVGEKLKDADLIGIPYRVVVSSRSLADGGIEVKKRNDKKSSIVSIKD